jgi:hypothetical protein
MVGSTSTEPGRDQGAVLVDIVQAVEDPEIIALPAFVWFERSESVNCLLPHLLYFSANMLFVLRGFRGDEEAGFFPVVGSTASSQVELLGKMVEGGSEILDGVAQDDGNFLWDGLNVSHIVDWPSGLSVSLGGDFVGIGGHEGYDSVIEITDVLVGPFNFMPNKRNSFVGCHG